VIGSREVETADAIPGSRGRVAGEVLEDCLIRSAVSRSVAAASSQEISTERSVAGESDDVLAGNIITEPLP
jgi:hypothetical protein